MDDRPHSSPEPDDPEDEPNSQDMFESHSPTSPTAPSHEPGSTKPPESGLTSQKRRRVTRACDECRRKKIKCDGRQPCTHCTVYSYECSYDQPSNRRRNPPPQYIEALENRMQRAEALLRCFMPDLDLNEPGLDSVLKNDPRVVSSSPSVQPSMTTSKTTTVSAQQATTETAEEDTELESMVKTTGLLDLDEQGHWDYTGNSAGKTFLQNLRERFGVNADPFVEASIARSGVTATHMRLMEAPKLSYIDSPMHSNSPAAELPSKEVALELCDHGLDDAVLILACVHIPSFYKSLHKIYDTPHELYRDEDHKFLPLLYVVIALGRLYAKDAANDSKGSDYKMAMDDAYRYFWAARQLLDIAECRDIISLQAIVFMSLFLQCTAKLSTCYAYVGVALRSALRMGMHRSFKDSFNPLEAELRKRIFWVIRRMDIHVGAMLGLPLLLSDHDIDQEYPIEVDDEYITETEIKPMPEGQVSLMSAANHNFRLAKIVSKIVREIYPIKGGIQPQPAQANSYSVSFAKIREIENELHAWMESIPKVFRPGETDTSPGVVRIQRVLRMSYAYAQQLLYRPFLHYVSSQNQSRYVDQGAYICSAACISVSQNTIHITVEMMKKGLLVGSYWITMYTTFFAVLSLVYFVRENPSDANSKKVRKDASEGRAVLAKMAKRSWAADRCNVTLNALFASLPDVSASNKSPSWSPQAPGSKRRSNVMSGKAVTREQTTRSHPDLTEKKNSKHFKRASSFPQQVTEDVHENMSTSYAPYLYQEPQDFNATYQGPPLSMNHISPSTSPESGISAMESFSAIQNRFDMQSQQQASATSAPQEQQTQGYYDQSNLSEISALMFPSTDPFAYPNQPLGSFERTTFDNKVPFGQSFQGADPAFMNTATGVPNTLSNDENGQIFQDIPSYYTQPQQQSTGIGMVPQEGPGVGPTPNPQFLGTSTAAMWDPQGRNHGLPVNMNDIFGGGDWPASPMDPRGYQ